MLIRSHVERNREQPDISKIQFARAPAQLPQLLKGMVAQPPPNALVISLTRSPSTQRRQRLRDTLRNPRHRSPKSYRMWTDNMYGYEYSYGPKPGSPPEIPFSSTYVGGRSSRGGSSPGGSTAPSPPSGNPFSRSTAPSTPSRVGGNRFAAAADSMTLPRTQRMRSDAAARRRDAYRW